MATTPMSLDQFGQTIKAKHPEYSDLSNEDVANKVLAKYPQYKDMVQTAPEQPGFFENLGHAFGVGKEEAAAKFQQMKDHPIKTLVEDAMGPGYQLGKAVVGGIGRSASELGQAAGDLRQGNPASAAVHAVTAVPLVGPALNKMAAEAPPSTPGQSYMSRVAADATPGNVGTALGTAAQVAPMVLGAADSAAPGRATVPTPNLKAAAGRAVLLGKTPEAAYESALKPSTTLSQADRQAIISTGLNNEIPVSKAGLEKIGDQIDTLNQAIKDQIASDPNRPIDPNAVATRADQAKARFRTQVNAQPDLSAIEASKQQFLTEQGAVNGQPAPMMGAADAQAMKQGTYRVLAGKFGEQGSATVEAQKALARGLKEEIATQFPEINNLNATESKLLDLQPVLERAVNRISNHQVIGIGTPVAGAAAKAVTGSGLVGGTVATLKAVLDNPMVKSRLAIAVSKSQKIPLGQAAAKINAYSSALAASAVAQQANSSAVSPDQSTTPQ